MHTQHALTGHGECERKEAVCGAGRGHASSATSAKWPCAIPDLEVRQFSTWEAAELILGSRPQALLSALARAVSFSP